MDIYAPKGTRVLFTGQVSECQLRYGCHDNPYGILHTGETYTIDHTEVHGWRTKVFLKEHPGKSFNSVWFVEIQ